MTYQRNLILQAAVAAAFGLSGVAVHAGTGSALPATIATAAIKDDTTTAKGNAVTYSTQVPLSANTVYFVYVKLTNGKFASTPTASMYTSNNANLCAMLTSGSTVTLSTDKTFTVVTMASSVNVIPVNATISFTPAGVATNLGEVNTLTGLLGGGNVNAQISIGSSASATTTLADIDSAAGGNIITFAVPQTVTFRSSGLTNFTTGFVPGAVGAETQVIQVAAGTGVLMTAGVNSASTSIIDFGGFTIADVAGVQSADQTTLWTVANNYTAGSLNATVTGNFAAATSVYLSPSGNCAASLNSMVLNAAKTSATLAGGTANNGVGQGVCMSVNGTTTIPATQPTISIGLKPVGAFPGSTLTYPAAGPASLYSLLTNGGLVDVRSYIPVATGSYTSNIRVINVGQVTAAVSAAFIDPVTGVVGTSGVLGTIAAGGATNFTAAQIEAAIGSAPAGTSRPRVRITAPTALQAQHYIVNPNGTLTTLHGAD